MRISRCILWSVQYICKYFKEGRGNADDKYLPLHKEDERRNMSDTDMIEKYVDLDMLCFPDVESKDVMSKVYKNKDAYSIWGEIRKSPNI